MPILAAMVDGRPDRMKRAFVVAAATLLLSLASASAWAQPQGPREPIDGERFKPAVTYDGFVTAEGSAVRSTSDPWEFALFANYALNSLVVVNQDNTISDKFIAGRLGGDVMASVTLFDGFALGVGLPFFLAQMGDEDPDFGGLGDLRIVPKYRILDDRDVFGLAAAVELRVPTHVGDFSGGARNVVVIPKLIADHRFGGSGFRLGANVGVAIREGTQFEPASAGRRASRS